MNVTGAGGRCGKLSGAQGSGGRPARGRWRRHVAGVGPPARPGAHPALWARPRPRLRVGALSPSGKNGAGKRSCARGFLRGAFFFSRVHGRVHAGRHDLPAAGAARGQRTAKGMLFRGCRAGHGCSQARMISPIGLRVVPEYTWLRMNRYI